MLPNAFYTPYILLWPFAALTIESYKNVIFTYFQKLMWFCWFYLLLMIIFWANFEGNLCSDAKCPEPLLQRSPRNNLSKDCVEGEPIHDCVACRRVPDRFFGIRDWEYYKVGIREYKVRGEREKIFSRDHGTKELLQCSVRIMIGSLTLLSTLVTLLGKLKSYDGVRSGVLFCIQLRSECCDDLFWASVMVYICINTFPCAEILRFPNAFDYTPINSIHRPSVVWNSCFQSM